MNQELKNEVALRIPRMGNNEFLIGYSRAETKSVNEIAEFIEDHRKPFSDGRVASIGAAAMASAEVWQKIAEESDAAAKRELLKDSSELAELNKLERAAAEAKRLADAKQDELTRAWNEYNSLPEKAKAISLMLAQFDNTLRELEPEVLEKGYKDTFRSMLNGALVDGFALVFAAETIVTSGLRRAVINEEKAKLEHELYEVKARSKTLAKKLGMKANL